MRLFVILLLFLFMCYREVHGQCPQLDPGFVFLSNSQGCAPYQTEIRLYYLNASPGTEYVVDWGDGSPLQTYIQSASDFDSGTGRYYTDITKVYPNSSVDCGYDIKIDASDACNPPGSVDRLETSVTVWTTDPLFIGTYYRICTGSAASIPIGEYGVRNCYPRAGSPRENIPGRWFKWEYGFFPTPSSASNIIPGVKIDNATPPSFPYFDPRPTHNPDHPVYAIPYYSLPIDIPALPLSAVGREFHVKLRGWNRCNPYDENLLDGAFNPVSGDLINGDHDPTEITASFYVVQPPTANFNVRKGTPGGPLATRFCLGETIYLENMTNIIPAIPSTPRGSVNGYYWEIFDGPNDTFPTIFPITLKTTRDTVVTFTNAGPKLLRLRVKDLNAIGACETIFERVVEIIEPYPAQVEIYDTNGDIISDPYFCKPGPHTLYFGDVSPNVDPVHTQYRWEFENQNGAIVQSFPSSGFSSTRIPTAQFTYTSPGRYKMRLILRDSQTGCPSVHEQIIRIDNDLTGTIAAPSVCFGSPVTFGTNVSLTSVLGSTIRTYEWDLDYDSVFTSTTTFNNRRSGSTTYSAPGQYTIALRVITDKLCETILTTPVTVTPYPVAQLQPDITEGCGTATVNFTNLSTIATPFSIDQFEWQVDDGTGAGFRTMQTTNNLDPVTLSFGNTTNAPRTYRVRLKAKASVCETISPPVTITVFPASTATDFTSNYLPFAPNCSPVEIQFEADASTRNLNPSSYSWEIREPSGTVLFSAASPQLTYTFVNEGISIKHFLVAFKAEVPGICTNEVVKNYPIAPASAPEFTYQEDIQCDSIGIRFQALPGSINYKWFTNGSLGASGLSADFTRKFPRTPSDYIVDVRLETENLAGCSADSSQLITIRRRESITADFDVSPLTQTWPASTISLTNMSSMNTAYTYTWNMGDGTTIVDPNLSSYSYTNFGRYNITLRVEEGNCFNEITRTVVILPPVGQVNFTYSPPSGCVPLTVEFQNTSTYVDEATFEWDFGDNETSTQKDPTHVYDDPGTYTVVLTAKDLMGNIVREVKLMIIEVFEIPSAFFLVKPQLVYLPDAQVFTDNLTINGDTYLWDFGDGGTSTEFEPTHQYEAEGVYTIKLETTSANGCTNSYTAEKAVIVEIGGQILIPNVFTPDLTGPGSTGGKNDVFLPLMQGVVSFDFQVFNRWGQLLYQTNDPSGGWDGYYQGKLCQQDVYIYKLSATLENGQIVTRVGDINLLR